MYVRAEVNLCGIDELELYVEFEKKIEQMRQAKYPQASSLGVPIAGANVAGQAAAWA